MSRNVLTTTALDWGHAGNGWGTTLKPIALTTLMANVAVTVSCANVTRSRAVPFTPAWAVRQMLPELPSQTSIPRRASLASSANPKVARLSAVRSRVYELPYTILTLIWCSATALCDVYAGSLPFAMSTDVIVLPAAFVMCAPDAVGSVTAATVGVDTAVLPLLPQIDVFQIAVTWVVPPATGVIVVPAEMAATAVTDEL